MPDQGVLVDTSVWVRFFRLPRASESLHLDRLIQLQEVRTCAPVRAEVFSGARTERERFSLQEYFLAIPLLELPADAWERVEEARFRLARKGRQASLIDLLIACAAASHEAALWSLDEDFADIRQALPFAPYLPEVP